MSHSQLPGLARPSVPGTQLMWRLHGLKQEIFCEYGHPWFDLDAWLSERVDRCYRTVWARFRPEHRFGGFRAEVLKEAARHRAVLLDPGYAGPRAGSLQPLLPLLGNLISTERMYMLTQDDTWITDGAYRTAALLAGLAHVDEELAPARRLVFHCRAVHGLSLARSAAVTGTCERTVASTGSQTWRAMRDDKIDTAAVTVFLRDVTGGCTPERDGGDGPSAAGEDGAASRTRPTTDDKEAGR
ncbi:hypothetical protein [Kitasatospora sp. NBC_00458]|uniref:hypothetical protein n=1 Tax=Kitasatospora sp. NBC_00458 TaxID=2903568 RepID=UPI002E16D70F